MDLHPVVSPVRDLGEFIRERRVAAQISVRALAEKAGVSNPYLSQVERGLRRPSAEILAQIARALSMSVETLLAMAGILDTPEPPPPVLDAIRADAGLTERQKAALAEIYLAFRADDPAVPPHPPPESTQTTETTENTETTEVSPTTQTIPTTQTSIEGDAHVVRH